MRRMRPEWSDLDFTRGNPALAPTPCDAVSRRPERRLSHLEPSKLALHRAFSESTPSGVRAAEQRDESKRSPNGKTSERAQKRPHADRIVPQCDAEKAATLSRIDPSGA